MPEIAFCRSSIDLRVDHVDGRIAVALRVVTVAILVDGDLLVAVIIARGDSHGKRLRACHLVGEFRRAQIAQLIDHGLQAAGVVLT